MFYYLYKITNLLTNQIYIGVHKTNDLNDGYMGSGRKICDDIKRSGVEYFRKDILEFFEDSETMYLRESQIVDHDFISREDTYNLVVGGQGCWERVNLEGLNLYGKNGQIGYGGENLIRGDRLISVLKEKGTYDSYIEKISKSISDGITSGTIQNNFIHNNPMNVLEVKKKQQESLKRIKHQQGETNSQFGTIWITDGGSNKKIKRNESIPDGWYRGRKT